jgi:hypothetical protein
MTPPCYRWNKSSFSLCSLLLLGGLCGQLKSDFRPELGINLLQLCNQMLNVIAMVEQNQFQGRVRFLWGNI